jgi:hypothetical protein
MTASPVSADHLTHLVATALVRMSRVREPRDPVYEPAVRRAYDQVVLQCLRTGTEPPRSVPDLVGWAAHTPVGQWPVALSDTLPGQARLLDPGTRTPTQLCLEWAVWQHEVEHELYENTLMHGVLDATRARDLPESYVSFRRAVIATPVLTGRERAALLGDRLLSFLDDRIREAWTEASVRHLRDGVHTACSRCNLLLVPAPDGGWHCELDRCAREGVPVPGRRYDPAEEGGVYQVERPLRTFITGPGLAEVRLEADLRALGLDVELWPAFDAYDLRVTFPDETVWAIDVKDRADPALLGRTTRSFPARPPHHRALLVVPHYRFQDREDYGRVFTHRLTEELTGRIQLLSDRQLVREAREKREKSRA